MCPYREAKSSTAIPNRFINKIYLKKSTPSPSMFPSIDHSLVELPLWILSRITHWFSWRLKDIMHIELAVLLSAEDLSLLIIYSIFFLLNTKQSCYQLSVRDSLLWEKKEGGKGARVFVFDTTLPVFSLDSSSLDMGER